MKRRLLPILMTLVLVCALPIWAAFVTSGDVTNPLVCTAGATSPPEPVEVRTADELQSKITAGKSVKLMADINITSTLKISSSLTLDLNGHVLKMTGDGSVLYVKKDGPNTVTLTITDSRPQNPHTGSYADLPAGGVITGGNAEDGGGVYVEAYATLEMTGGCITGCRAVDGGGVYIDNNATLKMTGGCITDCHASYGGGIYSYENLYMGGTAKIEKCTSNGGSYDAIWNRERCNIYADGGTVDGTVSNLGTIMHSEGAAAETVFNGTVYNRSAGKIEAGIYKGTVENTGSINGGTFYGTVTNQKNSLLPEVGTITDGTFAVTFDRGDGTKTEPKLVPWNDKVPRPTSDPEKSGHTFIGWYLGDALYDFNTPITAPLTLTARWEEVPSSGGNYYYHPTTDTKADDAKDSPKTADPGVALYAALSLLSLTGLTCITKKR